MVLGYKFSHSHRKWASILMSLMCAYNVSCSYPLHFYFTWKVVKETVLVGRAGTEVCACGFIFLNYVLVCVCVGVCM